jgi:hypothetical protein
MVYETALEPAEGHLRFLESDVVVFVAGKYAN